MIDERCIVLLEQVLSVVVHVWKPINSQCQSEVVVDKYQIINVDPCSPTVLVSLYNAL